ncbi:MAG: FtsX-like permease family protein [Planctomycetota bacterium]
MESLPGPSWTSPYRWAVALRLLRARKINLISILGVTVGVASIIVVLAIMDGFQRDLRAVIRGTLSDVIVEIDPRELGYEEIRETVLALDGVKAMTLQRATFGLIQAATRDTDGARQNFLPVRIIGVLPEQEREVSRIFDFVKEAANQPEDVFRLDPPPMFAESTPHILMSKWLARRVGYSLYGRTMRPNDNFGLITFSESDKNNQGQATWAPNDRDVVCSRLYDSRNSEFDKLHIYVDLRSTVHDFFSSPDGVVTELRIKLDDYTQARDMIPRIERAIKALDPTGLAFVQGQTWEERQGPLLAAVNNEKVILSFVLFFIVLVACFTIFATLTMTVVEKTREIGVLRAMGATAPGILSIFMLNGALVGLVGAASGYGAGLYVASNVNPIREFLRDRFGWDIFPTDIYSFDYIPTYIDHRAALSFTLGAALSALFFAVIPAIRAARLDPVRALRYE